MSTSAVPDESPDVSIVVPVYACAACIEPLLERTRAIVQQEGWSAEWVFVDDASPDDAWPILKELSSKDARIRGLRFDRNCGQHFAIYAGLERARGRFSIVMDCDLEDPPEEIPSLMARARQGFDIVIATYLDRAHPAWRRFGSRLYFWMLGGANLDGARLSTYSVLSQRARSAFIAAPLAGRGYVSVLLRLGLPTAFVASHKAPRPEGHSSYELRKLSLLAGRNLLLFSPWRLACVLTTIAFGILLVAVGLWGAMPAIPIWVSCCILIAAGLWASRSYMLARGSPSPRLSEMEMLHD